jgi:hypothetical protein
MRELVDLTLQKIFGFVLSLKKGTAGRRDCGEGRKYLTYEKVREEQRWGRRKDEIGSRSSQPNPEGRWVTGSSSELRS